MRKINNPWYNIVTARETKRKARAHPLELGNLARAHPLSTKGYIIGLGIWRVCIRVTCVQNRLAYVSRDEPKTANCNLFIDNRKRNYYIKYRYNGTNSVWSFYLPFVNSWVAKTFDILRQKVSGASCYVNVCGTLVFVKVWKTCSKSWLV